MTTLRDILNDFAMELLKEARRIDASEVGHLVDKKSQLLDEYIEIIKERMIG